jgi:hypothetical protein
MEAMLETAQVLEGPTTDEGIPGSRYMQGVAVTRMNDTVAALKRDLAGIRIELLRLRTENTDLRQRLRDAMERVDKVRLMGLKARQSEILAMVRQRQKMSQEALR